MSTILAPLRSILAAYDMVILVRLVLVFFWGTVLIDSKRARYLLPKCLIGWVSSGQIRRHILTGALSPLFRAHPAGKRAPDPSIDEFIEAGGILDRGGKFAGIKLAGSQQWYHHSLAAGAYSRTSTFQRWKFESLGDAGMDVEPEGDIYETELWTVLLQDDDVQAITDIGVGLFHDGEWIECFDGGCHFLGGWCGGLVGCDLRIGGR